MKKIVVIIMLSLILCGCGCSKKKTKTVEKSYIGDEDVSYTLTITCGDKSKDSNVVFNKNKTASYELYECNNGVLELTVGEGTYKVNGSKATITGSYSEKIEVNVKDEKTIEINFDNIKQTLTK